MRVLVACEYSGVVRRAMRERGHEAYSCDLLPSEDESPFHIQGNVLPLLVEGWDMLIAHPPCTYLASSGMHRTTRGLRDPALTEEALEFVRVLMAAPVRRKALENPVGVISSRIRKPDQIIQPHQFGEDASKSTCLWIEGLPPLAPTKHVDPRWVCCGRTLENDDRYGCPNCGGDKKALPRWANQTDSGQNRLAPGEDRWKDRSRTYPGIAAAMADQWGCL